MLINIKIGKLMITERTILKTVYTLSGVYLTKAGIGGFMDNKRIESENKRIEAEKEVAFKKIDADKETALKRIEAELLCYQSK
jgi:hypothetical protein